MNELQMVRNIRLYYQFQATKEPIFWGAILITFIQHAANMNLAQICIMEAVAVGMLFILEIPTGALSDLIGRRRTIVIGSLFMVIDNILFSLATEPIMIWVANTIWVFGYTLISGADSSLLYDSLKVIKREGEFKNIEGRAISYKYLIVGICAIFSGYLASINLRLPVAISTFPLVYNMIIALKFTEPQAGNCLKYNILSHLKQMKLSVLFVANHIKIKWLIIFSVVISTTSHIWFFTYNPYFELVKLPITYFGWIFFALNMIACASSYFTDWISKKINNKLSVSLMLTFLFLPILLMGTFISKIMVLAVCLQNLTRGYYLPFIAHLVHDHIESSQRATVFSIRSAMVCLGQMIGLWIFAMILNHSSLPFSLQILGLFTFICSVFLIYRFIKIFPEK